jgi:hypothetical protein
MVCSALHSSRRFGMLAMPNRIAKPAQAEVRIQCARANPTPATYSVPKMSLLCRASQTGK